MFSRLNWYRLSCWILLAVSAGFCTYAFAKQSPSMDQLDLLVDVRHEILHEYVEEPDANRVTQSAARAMVEALEDPYTTYLTPEELEPFDKQIRGTFSGIGAEVEVNHNQLRIVTPLDDSPAWKAGIMAGDTILEIDNTPLQDLWNKVESDSLKLREAVKKLQGSQGTKVTLKVRHPGGEEATLSITRAQINVPTVRGIRRNPDGHWNYMLDPQQRIGYIRISQFIEKTAPDVRAALDQLLEQNVRAIILDLRFNPGGMLESAVQISNFFLPQGQRIVSVKGRVVPERIEISTGTDTIPPIPLVVLANEASASAAEVVTGALSDNQRAQFIGTRTFGKGSVQQVHPLESGGALKITNAYYYLPNGRNIHRRKNKDTWGVDPADGFWIPMTPQQTKDMLRARRESESGSETQPNTQPNSQSMTPDRIEKELADPQLAAALKASLGFLIDGRWPAVGQSGSDHLAKQAKRDTLKYQRDMLQERIDQIQKELSALDTAATQPASQPATSVINDSTTTSQPSETAP